MPRSTPRCEREWLSCTNSSWMPRSARLPRPVGLQEEAALVAVHDGFDQDRALEACVEACSRRQRAPARRGRRSGAPAPATRWPPARARCARAAPARSPRARSRPRACRRDRAPARACRRSRRRSRRAPSRARRSPPRPRERALARRAWRSSRERRSATSAAPSASVPGQARCGRGSGAAPAARVGPSETSPSMCRLRCTPRNGSARVGHRIDQPAHQLAALGPQVAGSAPRKGTIRGSGSAPARTARRSEPEPGAEDGEAGPRLAVARGAGSRCAPPARPARTPQLRDHGHAALVELGRERARHRAGSRRCP